jgi:hypothetical protein
MKKRQRAQPNKNLVATCLSFTRRVLVAHKIQIAVVLIGLVVLVLRRPDAIFNPQLFAEDGREWLQDALNSHYSIATLGYEFAGYLAVFPRLVTLFSGLFPLQITPLIFNVLALAVQVLPLVYLWSKRADAISVKFKIFATVFYLCLPFSGEIHANITNSQWYLALVLFILIFVKEPKQQFLKWLERVFMLVASLSGPFSILLTPALVYDSWRLRSVPVKYRIVFVGAAIQAASIFLSLGDRPHQDIGFSITVLLQIIGGQIFAAGLFGANSLHIFLAKPWITPIISVLGIQLMLYVFIKADRIIKYFLMFALLVFSSALLSPDGVPIGSTWWKVLAEQGVGARYFFIPHLAVLLSLGWILFAKNQAGVLLKTIVAVMIILAIPTGLRADFIHSPYKDLHYEAYIKKYENLKPGKQIIVPTNPGPPWQVIFKKE